MFHLLLLRLKSIEKIISYLSKKKKTNTSYRYHFSILFLLFKIKKLPTHKNEDHRSNNNDPDLPP